MRAEARARLGALFASVALAACGGGGGGSSASPVPSPTPTPSPGPGPIPAPPSPPPPTWVVGTGGTLPAGATRVAGFAQVPWASLAAGTRVLVAPGSYSGVVTIQAVQGTSAAPITLGPLDTTAAAPQLDNSIDIQGSAWLQVSGLQITRPSFAGVVLRLGSHHITVADLRISGAPIGINITTGAGTGHQLLRNVIDASTGSGINAEVNADAADRSLISANTITASGHHGIEVRASHYRIEHNSVSGSGQAIGGTSGIHLYSGSANEDSGDDNIVRWNRSFNNLDRLASDGNGIEADQWCDNNIIEFNATWGNDGAGIIVFNGTGNLVASNTVRDNGHDSGHTHGASGELVLGTAALQRTANNTVRDNLVQSIRSNWPAFYLNGGALGRGNVVGPNAWSHTVAGQTVVRWGDQLNLSTAAQVDANSGTSGSWLGLPTFSDAANPAADGLRLAARPALDGLARVGDVDLGGRSGLAGMAWFGAWFYGP